MILRTPYAVLSALFEDEECDDLVELGASRELQDARAFTGAYAEGEEVRRSGGIAAVRADWFLEAAGLAIQRVNERAGWNFQLGPVEPLQYSVYEPGDHFDWHSDMHDRPYGPEYEGAEGLIRKITFSVLLNDPDEFEGGDFQIEYGPPDDPDRIRTLDGARARGSMIVFPSFLYHRVAPVERGVRRALVGWVLGEPYR